MDLHRSVLVLDHGRLPTAWHHAFQGDLFREIFMLRVEVTFDDRECINDRLKAIAATKSEVLQEDRQHPAIMARVLVVHEVLIDQAVLRSTRLELSEQTPKDLFLDLRKDHLSHCTFWFFHDGLRYPKQDLEFALN